jgi:hypothetical protein
MGIRIGVSPYQRAIEVGRRGAGRPAVAHPPPSMCLPCATLSNGTVVKAVVMARKRRARDYTGALAEQIYLHRRETVDQVMARTVRKIPLLFKHHNIEPSDAQSWQKLAVRLALAHVPGLQVSMRGSGRKRTWKAGQGNELVRVAEDMQSRTGMRMKNVLVKLREDKLGVWKHYTVENLGARYREAKRFQAQPETWTPSSRALVLRRFKELLEELLEDWALEPPSR